MCCVEKKSRTKGQKSLEKQTLMDAEEAGVEILTFKKFHTSYHDRICSV